MKIPVAAFVLLCAMGATAQNPPAHNQHRVAHRSPQNAAAAGAPDRALMERIWNAWGTLNPDNAAPFYSKDPQNVFYDLTPLKYDGWAAYDQGVHEVLKAFKAITFTVGNDARVWTSGEGALGTATLHADITNANGSKGQMELRWTVVWHHEGEQWLIIHEHVSAPLPSETAHPPAPKAQ